MKTTNTNTNTVYFGTEKLSVITACILAKDSNTKTRKEIFDSIGEDVKNFNRECNRFIALVKDNRSFDAVLKEVVKVINDLLLPFGGKIVTTSWTARWLTAQLLSYSTAENQLKTNAEQFKKAFCRVISMEVLGTKIALEEQKTALRTFRQYQKAKEIIEGIKTAEGGYKAGKRPIDMRIKDASIIAQHEPIAENIARLEELKKLKASIDLKTLEAEALEAADIYKSAIAEDNSAIAQIQKLEVASKTFTADLEEAKKVITAELNRLMKKAQKKSA